MAEVSGFATLGASWFSNPHADFAYNNHSTGPGHTRLIDFGLDSNLGLQWSSLIDNNVRLTAQTVIYRDASSQITPSLTLFNALIPINDQFSLRVGRTQNPNFLYSDYRQVHYALPWIRPPREVYGVTSFFNYDGVQLRHQKLVCNNWDWVTLLGVANASMDYSIDGASNVDTTNAQAMRYVSMSLHRENWTVKVSYEVGQLTAHTVTVDNALNAIYQLGYIDLADKMSLNNKTYHFVSLSAQLDSPNWLLIGEVAYRSLDAYFGQRGGAYLTLGRHFGRYMPYLTLARTWTLTESNPQPIAQSLYDGVSYSASSVTLGVSFELSDNAILKAEAQGIAPDPGSRWVYEAYDSSYAYRAPNQDLLLSVSLDVVF